MSAAFAFPALAQDAPTVVIVVRHGEKQMSDPTNPDPPLSEAGARRAQSLIQMAEEAGVSVIYTTQFRRARETAQPLADKLKIPVVPMEVNGANLNGYATAMAKEILTKHAGKTVLVIGHTNTVPQMVEALGGKLPPAIDDAAEFDRLFVVIAQKKGAVKVVKGRYGESKS
ncbi:MAG TPA: phosphoglycerate mutase family protein [Pyrinomonadaceae bacterium]